VALENRRETARGRTIYKMLLAVHARVRRDLEWVERLAARAIDGLPAEEIRRELGEIKRDSTLWRLQVDCLRYCSFVHLHHNAEDVEFFPELRETNPAINPVVDRLEAEHRRASDDLDRVEAAAKALAGDESRQARQAVVDALGALEQNLLAHLDFEELNIESTTRRLRDWTALGVEEVLGVEEDG
jgi:iron-sulfur cluster repair protein YtfE (RIC family)